MTPTNGLTKAVLALAVATLAVVGTFTAYVAVTRGTVEVHMAETGTERPEQPQHGWSHVYVTFSEVQVHRAGAANDSDWVTLSLAMRTIDFVTLGNASALLGLNLVPTGTYTQLRIVVESATGVLLNGTAVDLTVPSGELRTMTPFGVNASATTTVTLELDLEASIHQADGMWVFVPVIGSIEVS